MIRVTTNWSSLHNRTLSTSETHYRSAIMSRIQFNTMGLKLVGFQTDMEYGDKIISLRKNGLTGPYIAEGSVSQEILTLMLTG